jgi:hypothetical protein
MAVAYETMNNENTQLLTLDDHIVPCTEMQRFVDGLVNAYEQRILKAKVVQLDHTSRAYAPVLDLDAHDAKPAEEDVLSARIFPTQDTEMMREALVKELDTAVENYANAIIRHSKTAYALTVRALYITRSVLHFVYTRMHAFSADMYRLWQARVSERREDALLHAALAAHKGDHVSLIPERAYAEHLTGETAVFRDSVPAVAEVPAVLTYTYELQHAPVKEEQIVAYQNAASATPAVGIHSAAHGEEITQEPLRWEHVARCLYLQFRYGPTDFRTRPELWD